jgi:hypothetical protein
MKRKRKPWKAPERCRLCSATCGFVPGLNGWVRCTHNQPDGKATAVKE